MMNIGIVLPQPGYLEGVRELCTRHGVVLIFDEVKCGATIAAGGAIERFGVQPDLACFAKSMVGRHPGAAPSAAGPTSWTRSATASPNRAPSTGIPWSRRPGLASLTEVLTPDAYEHFKQMGTRLAEGCRPGHRRHDIPAHVIDLGCKGCVSYRREPLVDYRSFLETDADLFDASWAWLVNRGIFMTPGNEEQWTLSVQHEDGPHRPVRRRLRRILRRPSPV